MIEQLNWTELNIIPYFPRGLELACRCQLAQIPNLHSRQELSPALTEKHVIGEGRDKRELHFSYNFVIPCCCLIGKLCLTLCDPMDCSPPGFSVHGILQARTLGVGCHFLLQGIFPTQGSNLHLLHCTRILYHWATRETPIPCTQAQS